MATVGEQRGVALEKIIGSAAAGRGQEGRLDRIGGRSTTNGSGQDRLFRVAVDPAGADGTFWRPNCLTSRVLVGHETAGPRALE